uniref:Uncharacterized protein n=1 Tax=Oncorhynchus tshawytscha TaxID=74940 RepID=A0AAZ3PDX7_ONCTS
MNKVPSTFLNFIQILFGAGHWVTIAANKYEGSIHLVLFVAQDLVLILGGDWRHDLEDQAVRTLQPRAMYKVYLAANVLALWCILSRRYMWAVGSAGASRRWFEREGRTEGDRGVRDGGLREGGWRSHMGEEGGVFSVPQR